MKSMSDKGRSSRMGDRNRGRVGPHAAFLATLLLAPSSFGQDSAPTAASQPVDQIAPNPDAEAALLAAAGPSFQLRRTDHFVVAYNSDEATLRPLVSRLEATYDAIVRFCRINKINYRPLTEPLQVVFYGRHDDFCKFAVDLGFTCENLNGFYFSSLNRAAFYDIADDPSLSDLAGNIERLKKSIEDNSRDSATRARNANALRRDRDELRKLERRFGTEVDRMNRLTVQHEAAHQVLYNFGVHVIAARNPGWLVEGLACIFESPPTENGAGAGVLNTMRLQDLRSALNPEDPAAAMTAAAWAKALEAKRILPLRELVGDAQIFSRRSETHLVYYYAQAWSLVYYLQRRHREEFAQYLATLSTRERGEETTRERELADFESAFGPLDQRFEERWFNFVKGLNG